MASNTGKRKLRTLNFYGYTDRPEMDGMDVFGEIKKQQLINIGQQLEIDNLYITIETDSGNTVYTIHQGDRIVGEILVDTFVRDAYYDAETRELVLVIGSEGGTQREVRVPIALPGYYPENSGLNAQTITFRKEEPAPGSSGDATYYLSVNLDQDTLSSTTDSGVIYARIDEELSPKSHLSVANSAVTNTIWDDELAVAKALHELKKTKQKLLEAGSGIQIYEGEDKDIIESQVFVSVDHLPLEGKENLIYLKPLEDDPTLYGEYAWIDNQWVCIGGSAVVDKWFDPESSYALANSAITKVISEDEEAVSQALFELKKTKQHVLSAGTGIHIYEGKDFDLVESRCVEVVDHLPYEGLENIIYVIGAEEPVSGNTYSEYVWIDGQWELIGGGGVVDKWFDSASTHSLVNSAITKVISDDELAMAKALLDLDKRKQNVLSAGTGVQIYEGNGFDLIESHAYTVVDHLPLEGEENLMYLVPIDPTLSGESNVFAEYVWIDGKWEILGGAAITDFWFDSGSTFPLVNSAITKVISEDEEAVSKALFDLEKRKQKILSAGTGIKIYEGDKYDVIESQNFTVVDHLPLEGEENLIYLLPLGSALSGENNVYGEYVWIDGQWETLGGAAITDNWFDSGSTFPLVNSAITKVISEIELTTAQALIELKNTKQKNLKAGAGIKIYEGADEDIIESQNFTVVDHLPLTGEENLIYLLPLDPSLSADSNVFAEYVWINNKWETLGAATITDEWFDSGSTYPLVNSAITKVISEDELAVAKALLELQKTKQKVLEAGAGIKIYEGKDKDIIESQNFTVVDHLPLEGEENLIYLLPIDPALSADSNVFAEYVWINNKWETLGAATITDEWFDSGSTFPLVNSAITKVISEDELAVAKALLDLDKRKQKNLKAGSGIKIYEGANEDLIESQNFTVVDHLPLEGEENLIYLLPVDPALSGENNVFAEYVWIDGQWETLGAAAITDNWFDSGSTFPLVNSAITKVISEDELAIAKALFDLNKRKQKNLTAGSGIRIYEGQDTDIIESQNFVIVDHLPMEGEENLIYLMPVDPTLTGESNVYAEYIWTDGAWEILGSAPITDFWFDSGSTFPLVNSAITKVISEDELATAKALHELKQTKQKNLTAGVGIKIYEGEESDLIESQNFTLVDHLPTKGEEGMIYLLPLDEKTSGESNSYGEFAWINDQWEKVGGAATTDEWFDSASTMPLANSAITKVISEDEEAVAKALIDLEKRKQKTLSAGTGIQIFEGKDVDLIESQSFVLVDHLPLEGKENIIYLLPLDEKSSGESNSYGEYAWIDGEWEKVGGSSSTDEWFSSASTFPLANSAITKAFSDDEKATAEALHELRATKQKVLTAGAGINIYEGNDSDVIESQNYIVVDHLPLEGEESLVYLLPMGEPLPGEPQSYGGHVWVNGEWATVGSTATTDMWFDSASTMPLANSAVTKVATDDELTIAEALTELKLNKQDKLVAGKNINIYADSNKEEIEGIPYVIAEELPETGETDTLYLLTSVSSTNVRTYVPYIYENDKWYALGGTNTVDETFDSGSTNALANSAITQGFYEVEEVVAAALTDLSERKIDAIEYDPDNYSLRLISHPGGEESSGETVGEVVLGKSGKPVSAGTDIFVESTDDYDKIFVSGDTVIDSASTRVVQSKTIYEELDKKLDKVNFINNLYPKGSVYITYEYKNPSTFIGGEWELIGGEDADKNYYPAFAIDTDTAGTTINESLPNITGSVALQSAFNSTFAPGGAFSQDGTLYEEVVDGSGPRKRGTVWFNANKSSSIYQDGAHVNVNAIKLFHWRRTDDGTIVEQITPLDVDVTDVLWEGTSATGASTITLSNNFEDYKQLKLTFNSGSWIQIRYVETKDIKPSILFDLDWANDESRFCFFQPSQPTSGNKLLINTSGSVVLKKVEGLKPVPTSEATAEVEDVLWTGSQGQATNVTITLSDSFVDYKYLKFYTSKNENRMIDDVDVKDINVTTSSSEIIKEHGWDSALRYFRFHKTSNTTFEMDFVDLTLYKITGVKRYSAIDITAGDGINISEGGVISVAPYQKVTCTKTSLIGNEFYFGGEYYPALKTVHIHGGFAPTTAIGNGSGICRLTIGSQQVVLDDNVIGYVMCNNNATYMRFCQGATNTNQITARDLTIETGRFYWLDLTCPAHLV